MQRVVAAVIEKDGFYLVCRRPQHKLHGGLWEFPGGKLEPQETLESAAIRELAEELSLLVRKVGKVLFVAEDADSGFVIEFVDVSVEGELQLHEHSAYLWATCAELNDLPLAPSDKRFVDFLQAAART
jgi:8-oxo-dGTP diphosphatase